MFSLKTQIENLTGRRRRRRIRKSTYALNEHVILGRYQNENKSMTLLLNFEGVKHNHLKPN